ncbi:signal peptidase I [Candidatus Dependentiae bacterium]|nr:signal peptidase I [Candidatus Dependentiae bacterium]
MARTKQQQQGFLATIREIIVLLLIVFLIRTFGFGLYQVPSGSMETTMLVGERFFADKLSYLFTKPKHGDIIAFNDPLFDYSSNPVVRLFQEYVWGPSNWTKRVIGIPGDTIEGKIENGQPVMYRNGKKLAQPFVNKYPLIGLWTEHPVVLRQKVEQQTARLVLEGQLPGQHRAVYMERMLNNYIMWRSYDDAYAYNKQPFYRMNEQLVIKDQEGAPLLREPNTPLAGSEVVVEASQKNVWSGTDVFHVELGPNQYWLMGDNRLGSNDSRFLGPVDGRLIHGKILFLIWSSDSYESWWIVDLIKHPIDFWSRMRWGRFFTWLG